MFQVLVSTSAGDIDIELWSKEAPKASRNFVQLCLEGYYNDTIFHRIVKGKLFERSKIHNRTHLINHICKLILHF